MPQSSYLASPVAIVYRLFVAIMTAGANRPGLCHSQIATKRSFFPSSVCKLVNSE